MDETTDPDGLVLRSYHENYIGAISWVAQVTPGGSVHALDGVVIARSGLGISAFNSVFGLELPSSIGRAERLVKEFFGAGTTPWVLLTRKETTQAFAPLIASHHLVLVETLPGMVWNLASSGTSPTVSGLEIRQVRTTDEARQFARTMMSGFEADADLFNPWVDGAMSSGLADSKRVACYLGYVENRAVCTAVRFCTGGISGVYGVSTLPEFRRKGFGEAITLRAALDGRVVGCHESYLQSSTAGRRLYERIGYRVVEEYELWAPKGTLS